MKKFITYLFLTAFVLHTSSRVVVFFNFLIHQQEIAQTRCENKFKPELKCNGHCQLTKELKKDNEGKQKDEQQHQLLELNWIVQNNVVQLECDSFVLPTEIAHYSTIHSNISSNYNSDIFQPPIL